MLALIPQSHSRAHINTLDDPESAPHHNSTFHIFDSLLEFLLGLRQATQLFTT